MSQHTAAVVPLHKETERDGWKLVLERIKRALADGELVRDDPALFRPMTGQPRAYFDPGGMQRLTESIREVGQIQLGLARRLKLPTERARFELIDGERRWRAVSEIPLPFYRALVIDIDDEAAGYITSAIANFNREGNTPTEISDSIHKLHSMLGVPIPEVAKLFGLSEHYTYQLLGLQNLHVDVRAMLDPRLAKDRILPTTAAIQISKLHPELQVRMADQVLNKTVSLKTLRNEVVRTGEVHGAPVRTRQVRPDKQWQSIMNTARSSADGLRSVRDRAKDPHTARMIAEQGHIAMGALICQVDEYQKIAQETLRILREIASRKP